MNPAQMATGGGQMPPQQPQQAPQQAPPQGTVAPGQTQPGGDIKKILQVLSMAIQQTVDGQGFVDMQKLIMLWPQIAQQMGVNVPFQSVMQMIQQNPNLISDIIVQHGLSGITMNGRRISAEQLAGLGTGAVGGGRM